MSEDEPDLAPALPVQPTPLPPTLPDEEDEPRQCGRPKADAAPVEPPKPVLTSDDLTTIDLQLEEWRAGKSMKTVREYALSQAIKQMEDLEGDVRQALTASQLKDACLAHLKMSHQVSDMLRSSGLTKEQVEEMERRLCAMAMTHMMACDTASAKPLTMKDRRVLIQMSMQLRAIVTRVADPRRRR
jgi:hypothetical protein